MKTIIKITKQEAIEAWKKQNDYQNDKELLVEIEKDTKYFTPQTYSNRCLLCGKDSMFSSQIENS